MLLMMPLDEWFMKMDFSREAPETQKGIEDIISWVPSYPIYETWLTEEDIPDELLSYYQKLKVDCVCNWCKRSKEWRSLLALHWESLLILPFASVAARIAAIFLKELAIEQWARRTPTINWLKIDFKAELNVREIIGGYASSLWNIWRDAKTLDRALNITACQKEITAASILIASIELIPVYLWSELLNQLLCLPGWEMPFTNDTQREILSDWLKDGIPPQKASQTFQSQWCRVLGRKAETTTALILREWFFWKEKSFDIISD